MLRDFLVSTGIPNEYVFCSSLPGNDVKHTISPEVKERFIHSSLNIAILSDEYYKSMYCVNEAGIIWFLDRVPVVVIGLPEISHDNMCGFLNSDNILRRLDEQTDIAQIYDIVRETVDISPVNTTVVISASKKLTERYNAYIATRTNPVIRTAPISEPVSFDISQVVTDDECAVLYYVLLTKIRKINKTDIRAWFVENEIYGINVENAFDLLAAAGVGNIVNETLEMHLEVFRVIIRDSDDLLLSLSETIDEHEILSKDTFLQMWERNGFSDADKLFVSYSIENRVSSFGARWKGDGEVEEIKRWESMHGLDDTLSDSYKSCLSLFTINKLVMESDWTSYGNAREYTLCKSLKEFLFDGSFPYNEDLQLTIQKHSVEIPF